jgi:hypothetical protein
MQALKHNLKQLTIYSDGAINSMVEDLISGLLVGSPYVLLTGSYWNSSGTIQVKNIRTTMLQSVLFSGLLMTVKEVIQQTLLPLNRPSPYLAYLLSLYSH